MWLDIGLADARTTTPYPAMKLSSEDAGDYWFCFPAFEELAIRTGEMIDLYDGAWFGGEQLDGLAEALGSIREEANAMPEVWEVCVGYSVASSAAPTERCNGALPIPPDADAPTYRSSRYALFG